jgi:hypothetical protein
MQWFLNWSTFLSTESPYTLLPKWDLMQMDYAIADNACWLSIISRIKLTLLKSKALLGMSLDAYCLYFPPLNTEELIPQMCSVNAE